MSTNEDLLAVVDTSSGSSEDNNEGGLPSIRSKRPRENSPETVFPGAQYFTEPDFSPPGVTLQTRKRSRLDFSVSTNLPRPEYLLIHHVTCQLVDAHNAHKQEALFFDIPKLYAGDSKASALRGKSSVSNINQYLANHPAISFIIYRTYNCNEYHEAVKDRFCRLQFEKLDPAIIFKLKAHFSILEEDCEEAIPGPDYIHYISDPLKRAIQAAKWVSGGRFTGFSLPQDLCSPYLSIYHSRNFMDESMSSSSRGMDLQTISNLKLLYEFVRSTCEKEWDAADKLFQSGMVNRLHFSKLFAPGEIVVTNSHTEVLAYLVESVEIVDKTNSLVLNCTSWILDEVFRKKKYAFTVEWDSSEDHDVAFNNLELYPLRYDNSGLEERLRKRGVQFYSYRRRAFVGYETQDPRSNEQVITLRYMVDNTMYKQLHDDESENEPQDDLEQIVISSDQMPPRPFCLLLPATIRGFGLHDKKWKILSVENTRPIKWNKEAFERHLVLKPQKKELVKALVTVHVASSANTTTDIIEGKGKGLIILLHGGPGTGKTLTAESVAEIAERPLYRVTCGDIGTDPEGVEKYLNSVLYIGTVWGCVVLLDEADVFLEERTQMDLQRNALVSVFLRVLEYYQGILILTTNRVGEFDEGFRSRVSCALHYPSLDEKGRWEIWSNFIASLRDQGEDLNREDLKAKLDVLARHKLNGRQIRNTINTARQLAKYKRESLAYNHIDQAIDVANDFEEYVIKTHGHSDEERVRSQGTRY